MSIELFIYLAGMVDSLSTCLGILGSMSIVMAAFAYIFILNEEDRLSASNIKGMLIFGFLFIAMSVFIPSSRTMYMIAGVHYGKEAMQTETAQKVAKLLNGKLDEELAKLTNEKPAP